MLKSHKAETLVPRGVPVRTDPSTENPRTGIGIYSGPRVDVGQLSGGHCAGGQRGLSWGGALLGDGRMWLEEPQKHEA